MDALLLFSHGSLLCGAGAALDEHAARLRDAGRVVEVGYLNYSEPTLEQAAERLAENGARRIVVLPYFLVPGFFVTKSLPERLPSLRARHPGVEFLVADALGSDDLLADALIEAANRRRPVADEWSDTYAAAAAACRGRADCPLYSTSRCPASATSTENGVS